MNTINEISAIFKKHTGLDVITRVANLDETNMFSPDDIAERIIREMDLIEGFGAKTINWLLADIEELSTVYCDVCACHYPIDEPCAFH